ncbi:MAG: TIGR04282 family arsenosugar biosynthesis glycosyltransferase [Halieaceae bacterium]|jgi:rSAM/selenodomain-associated transferase 1|nr:TIGR04282 family arsenosugar biosynthesis glycosyltransferase [Halieaceae bacterium]
MVAERAPSLFIQFAREPVAGAVKTRMSPGLTPQQALDLHCQLVLWTSGTLVGAGLGPVELAIAGSGTHALFEDCLALGVRRLDSQRGGDLGERMYNAMVAGLERFERVVLVGSDCPGIDCDYLEQALGGLDRADLVLGPAVDGGYVLIGAKRVSPALFEGISWGSATVLAETLQRLRRMNWSWQTLPPLADIDRPEDLALWEAMRGG